MKRIAEIWFKVALGNFLFAAIIGTILRLAFVTELTWVSYKAFEEAHEYTALIGWTFLALFSFLCVAFVEDTASNRKTFNAIFWITEFLVLANAVNHIFTGNKLAGTIILALISFSVFYFIFSFIRKSVKEHRSKISFKVAVTGLIFLGASFLSIYLMPFILQYAGSSKLMYFYLAVQFFLHFEYNGWFVFAVLALLLRLFEEQGDGIASEKIGLPFRMLVGASILTFALSIYWLDQKVWFFLAVASIGGILQIVAVVLGWKPVRDAWRKARVNVNRMVKLILFVSLVCFLGKLLMQVVIIIPEMAELAFTIRNYVIAFLHLVFIGFLSMFILGWAIHNRFVVPARLTTFGVILLLTGFILMELILFVQGTMLWTGFGFIKNYYELIFVVSVLLPAGIGCFLLRVIPGKTTS